MKTVFKFVIVFFIGICHSVNAQNAEEVKSFINRTHAGIQKSQKEIMNKSQRNLEKDLISVVYEQAIAVKLFNAKNYKDALVYSYKSRTGTLTILETISPSSADYFKPNEEERKMLSDELLNSPVANDPLTKEEAAKITSLDIKNPQQLRTIALSVN
jgi:hypothetical protein